jgi:hypothetical protein
MSAWQESWPHSWHPLPDTTIFPPSICWWAYGKVYAISSPNVSFLPTPSIGERPSTTYIDGHFGHHEISRWPQEIDGDAIHRAWIRNPPDPHGDLEGSIASFRLQLHHFQPSGATRKARCPTRLVERLKTAAADAVSRATWFISRTKYEAARPTALFHALQLTLEKLETCDLSWREMNEAIAETQRHIVELVAYSDYRLDIETKWKPDVPYKASSLQPRIGGFTSSAFLATVLNLLGVPVWVRLASVQGWETSQRSFHIIYPVDYLEMTPWPTDTSFTTSNSSAMLRDLSAFRTYPKDPSFVPTLPDDDRTPAYLSRTHTSRERSASPREFHPLP